MSIPLLVNLISIVIWLFPPFKQRKTDFFQYFLILALNDPVLALSYVIFHTNPIKITFVSTYLLFVSLLERDFIKKNKRVFILFFIFILAADIWLSPKIIYDVKLLLEFLVLVLVIKKALLYLSRYQKVNLFLTVLVFYEITIIIKYVYITLGGSSSVVYFYLTSFFEYFIGIFFSIYNKENSPNFSLFKEDMKLE
jgi:hypothetical protein